MSLVATAKPKKVLTAKVAEKLFDSLRQKSPLAFRQLKGVLVRWERSDNQAECYDKIQEILTPFPQITKEVNEHLQENAKFAIHNSFSGRLQELFKYLNMKNTEYLSRVLQTLKKIEEEGKGEVQDKRFEQKVKRKFLQTLKDDQQTYNKAKTILDDAEAKQKPKEPQPKKPPQQQVIQEQEIKKPQPKPKPQKKRQMLQVPMDPEIDRRIKSSNQANPGVNPEQMMFMQKLDKRHPSFTKLLHLYELCIISRFEFIDLVRNKFFQNEQETEAFKDIIELRAAQRRKVPINKFKPLNDMDFTNTRRLTLSYVPVPQLYSKECSRKTPELKQILNGQYVSVPHGSEHSTFSIRKWNPYQQLLLKSEDQRYEFDLYSNRLRKCVDLLTKVICQPQMSEADANRMIDTVARMGVIQSLYKNSQKQQRDEIQAAMKSSRLEVCGIIRARMLDQLDALRNIRYVHGIKTWHQIAQKNFTKSLDRKCFQLRKNQKDYIKPSFVETQIENHFKQIKTKGYKIRYFDDSSNPFRVLNSFECMSRNEFCESHSDYPITQYNTQLFKNKHLVPAIFMLLNDKECCEATYSFINFHINCLIQGEAQKSKIKKFAAKFFEGLFKCRYRMMFLKDDFNEEMLDGQLQIAKKLNQQSTNVPEINSYRESDMPGLWEPSTVLDSDLDDLGDKQGRILIKKQENDELGYLPVRQQSDLVIFMSTTLYTVVRSIYTLYQRMLKARQILFKYSQTKNFDNPAGQFKWRLFKTLLMHYIKAKQTSKYDDSISTLLGSTSSYLFATMHKLMDNLVKSLQTCLNCQVSCKLLEFGLQTDSKIPIQNQFLYLMLVHKLVYSTPTIHKIVRLHISPNNLVSVNCLPHRPQAQQRNQTTLKEVQRIVEDYVIEPVEFDQQLRVQPKRKEVMEQNRMELATDQGYKFFAGCQTEDFLLRSTHKKMLVSKMVKKELKRKQKLQDFIAYRLK